MTSKIYVGALFAITTIVGYSCRNRGSSSLSSNDVDSCNSTPGSPQSEVEPITVKIEPRPFAPQDVVNKQPLLIYYVVDTKEPFFQATVDYEIRQLKSACNGLPSAQGVNWVAMVNSHFVNGGKFLVCKNGKMMPTQLYSHYPEIYSRLNMIQTLIRGGYSDQYNKQLQFHVRFLDNKDNRDSFADHVLAHPQALRDLQEFAQTKLFDPNKYIPFLHMKSHGSEKLFLTGLTGKETDSKTVCQVDILKKQLAKNNLGDTTPEFNLVNQWATRGASIYGRAGIESEKFPELDKIMDLALLRSTNTLGKENGSRLGSNNGRRGLSTENGRPGLGREDGGRLGKSGSINLQSGSYFGLEQPAFLSVQVDLIEKTNQPLGFVFAESCDSNVAKKPLVKRFFDNQPEIMGHFSAVGGLQYHNINWNVIYSRWADQNGDVIAFQNLLAQAASDVPNLVEKSKH